MKIRCANNSDIDDVLSWRNDELTRKMSKSQHIVDCEEHKFWFESILIDPLRILYIGFNDDNKVGICHFKCDDHYLDAEVSINLNPIMRKKKFAEVFLRLAMCEFFKTHRIDLRAVIKKNNFSSARIFQKCGFNLMGGDEAFDYYRYSQLAI